MKISAELPDKIQKVIDEFVLHSEPFLIKGDNLAEKIDLRQIAVELNVLPVVFDWFACWGINPNNEIILFQFEKPYKIKTETNQKIINMVLFETAKKYPELEELMPVRNPESIVCSGCDGSGISKEFADNDFLAKSIRCNCGGVGWLPSTDKKYLYF